MVLPPPIFIIMARFVTRQQGGNYSEASYLAFVQLYMPAGMIGLLVAAMFAASMSSIDSGLNRNAGIIVKNFYHPIIHKKASPKELLVMGKVMCLELTESKASLILNWLS